MRTALALVAAMSSAGPVFASPATVDALGGQRRLLLVSAPSSADPRWRAQQAAIATWRGPAQERDVTVIGIVGDTVQGAGDAAASLRARYDLPNDSFAAALVGKDGHVALRSTVPLSGDVLEGTIDAMPMRRAGQR